MKTKRATIIDRIRGYFQLRAYMRRFERDKEARRVAMAEIRAERTNTITL